MVLNDKSYLYTIVLRQKNQKSIATYFEILIGGMQNGDDGKILESSKILFFEGIWVGT